MEHVYRDSEETSVDPLLHDDHSEFRLDRWNHRLESRQELRHFVVSAEWQLTIADTITEHDDLLRVVMIGLGINNRRW